MRIRENTSTVNTTLLTGRQIGWIVIHYTAGVTSKPGSAGNLARWYKSGKAAASSDYIVVDSEIILYNPDIKNRYTWGVGGAKYTVMSTGEGGKAYGKCTNKNCINVEICSNKRNRSSLLASDKDWYFTEEELTQAAELVGQLMGSTPLTGDT